MPTPTGSRKADTTVQCRVLGPVDVLIDGQPVAVGGRRQRLVLALLVSRAKTTAPTDWLADAVWGDDPPRTARRTLQVYVTRLRHVLGGQGVSTVPGGYRLGIPLEHIDWLRFEALAAHGAELLAADASAAARELTAALDLWRGAAYGDLADVDALLVDAGRLEELRQATVERRIEADLALGKAATLLPEIDELVLRYPLRERLRGLQMLALYQSGRQADALTAFQAARSALVDGLGIEPGRALRELHERILTQDATLETTTGTAVVTARRPSGESARDDLPSGVLTFVVCDIEGSTRLLRRAPDEYPEVLDRHRRLVQEAFAAHSGVIVAQQGDGTRAVFTNAADALLACVEAQQALAAASWPTGVELRLRMGVHTGLASPKNDDYVSVAVYQAARIADAARGGQVLVSAGAASAVQQNDDIALTPLGRFRIPDFDDPESLSQLVIPGLDAGTPAPRARPAEGHNLTRPATSFVDRESEFAELSAELEQGGLVTLAGPGGVGKSRLAVEVALAAGSRWSDGVWRLAIDDLPDAGLLSVSIADAIGMPLSADDPTDALLTALQERHLLLLLDGCERHLEAVAHLVGRLLQRRARSGVLATTQEPLHLAGERVLRLRPLPTTVTTDVPGGPSVSPAVQLFVDRARAADSEFRLTDENVEAVVEVTRRLDGLPLAAEIAAARVAAFTPAELLESLERSTRLLRSKDPSLPGRHRTMHSLLSWSEGLLTDGEQATLRRLAVFAGPFTLAQARVAGEGPDDESDIVPDHLWSLVDHSIVLADAAAGGTRYRMLQLVRRFAEERLTASGEETATALRVGEMFAAAVGPRHASTHQWTSAVAADLDSIRSVAALLYRSNDDAAIDIAGELSAATLRYLDGIQAYRVAISEAEGWLSAMPPRPVRVAITSMLAMLHLRADEVEAAQRLADEAQELKSEVGAPSWELYGPERARGEVAIRSGRPDEAIAIAERELQTSPDARGRTRLFSMLGRALVQRGDLAGAAQAYHGELEASLELGDDMMTTIAQTNAAEIALRLGRRREAAEHQLECLRLARALGQPVFVAYSAIMAGKLLAGRDPRAVIRVVTKGLAVLDSADHALYEDDADEVAALLGAARGELSEDEHRQALDEAGRLSLESLAEEALTVLDRVDEQ